MLKNKNLRLTIDDVIFEQVEHTKCVGVIIKATLAWEDHIKTVCNKVSNSIGILVRIRTKLNDDILLTLYLTLIQPYLEYCYIIWASQHTAHLLNNNLKYYQQSAISVESKQLILSNLFCSG